MAAEKCHALRKKERDELIRVIKTTLSKREEIVFALAYGSFLDNSFFRDIDVGVYVDVIPSHDCWDYEAELAQELEDALGHRYRVEPKVINRAPLSFCYHVIRGRLLSPRLFWVPAHTVPK